MKKTLSANLSSELLNVLENRFKKHMNRHKDIDWKDVLPKLKDNETKLWSLSEMERTGGEPDIIGYDKKDKAYVFVDCSVESPAGRRSLCFDKASYDARKENKPDGSAHEMAKEMGIEILTESDYRTLQQLGEFDLKTSSWIQTPAEIRKLGGALFADRRYDHVSVYHNGAQSYYAARGFRGLLKL